VAPRHDHDAGGDADVLAQKRALREATWDRMIAAGVGRFPAPTGRIPNFVGAEAAAERLRGLPAWARARTVKANPDSPQWPVRQRALEDGKVVSMAVPRLAEDDPFFLLDPDDLADTPRKASSIKGASRSARTVRVEDLEPVDLVVTGCVAVDRTGARLGKGGGFSDLEYALAWEAGLIGPDTVVVTTVHDVQVLPDGDIPVTDHDFRLDLIVTPDEVIECPGGRTPASIRWDELTQEKVDAIPLLRRLAALLD
jgi:5-formyltetrahydrofolate cyclo-ligase